MVKTIVYNNIYEINTIQNRFRYNNFNDSNNNNNNKLIVSRLDAFNYFIKFNNIIIRIMYYTKCINIPHNSNNSINHVRENQLKKIGDFFYVFLHKMCNIILFSPNTYKYIVCRSYKYTKTIILYRVIQ